MGLKSLFKKKEVESVPLYESEISKFEVLQRFDLSGGINADRQDDKIYEPRILAISEEGIQIFDPATNNLLQTVLWRDMKYFEVIPVKKLWSIEFLDSDSPQLRFKCKQFNSLHTKAEKFLKRAIRNKQLKLDKPEKSNNQFDSDELKSKNGGETTLFKEFLFDL